jgi:hypothetical protein
VALQLELHDRLELDQQLALRQFLHDGPPYVGVTYGSVG